MTLYLLSTATGAPSPVDTTVPDTFSPQHVVQVRLEPRVRHCEIAMFIKGNSLSATPFIGTQVRTFGSLKLALALVVSLLRD